MKKQIHIGFTGTRMGMTILQRAEFIDVMFRYINVYSEENITFHHGSCIGADAEAHKFALKLCIPIHVHPCNIPEKTSICEGAHITHPQKPPLERNIDIVQASDLIIACPCSRQEVIRSGTWHTVRQARKKDGMIIQIIWPIGE